MGLNQRYLTMLPHSKCQCHGLQLNKSLWNIGEVILPAECRSTQREVCSYITSSTRTTHGQTLDRPRKYAARLIT